MPPDSEVIPKVQADKQTKRQTNKQTNKQTNDQTDGHTHTQTWRTNLSEASGLLRANDQQMKTYAVEAKIMLLPVKV